MRILSTRSDEQLSRTVRMFVCWLKIIGLAPFFLQQTKKSTSVFLFSKIGMAYNVLLSILVLVICGLAIPQLSLMKYSKKSSITHAIDIVQGILRTTTACLIILSGVTEQKKAISIMNRLLQVDCLLFGMKGHPSSERTSFTFRIIQMIFATLLWILFWTTEESYIRSFLHGFIINVPIFVIHWFVVEYSIVLEIVARKLKNLNKNLSGFEEFPNRLLRHPLLDDYDPSVLSLPNRCNQLALLELLNNICTTLIEVSRDTADYFSFPILPTVTCFFVALVFNLYYLVVPVFTPNGDANMSADINAVAWILVCGCPLILLSFNVTRTLNEAKLTRMVVHKVLTRTTRPEIRKELEQFSRQLMHVNLNFTAYGLFPLDFTLIQSILGATATYLIIIIQFTQSVANPSKTN